MKAMYAFLLTLALMGCSAAQFIDEHDLLVRKIVEQGTMRYIQARPEAEWSAKAVRVREVAENVRDASTSETITLERLREIALENLDMSPADMALAGDLFDTIAAVAEQQIQEDLSEGVTANHPATYQRIAGWAIAATRYYP